MPELVDLYGKKIGEIIKEVRLEKGMTQKDVADRASVSVAEICRLEKGERTNPSMQSVVSIFKAMNVDSVDFLKYLGY